MEEHGISGYSKFYHHNIEINAKITRKMINLPSFNCQFNVLYTADCPSLAACSQAKHFSQRPISIHDEGATSAKLQTNKTLNKLE